MKVLYFDCKMGAAGDMITASLLEIMPNKDEYFKKLSEINFPDVGIKMSSAEKCGIVGTHFEVLIKGHKEEEHHHHHEHHHSGIEEIEHIIEHLKIPKEVKQDAINIYKIIADAESKVHGKEVSQIHFHEVGAIDAIVDIVSACFLINALNPNMIISSPIHVGTGHVHCAHGILPVPAPATLNILEGVPIYSTNIKGELLTPTGAAIIKYFSHKFCELPIMTVNKIGYGMGTKDFERANALRVILGEVKEEGENIFELSCNLDDMTAEEIAFAQSLILNEGALDVYTTPIGMKKMRQGIKLSVLCKEELKEAMILLLFKHTSTLGIREQSFKRHILHREEQEVETSYGKIRMKKSFGFNVEKIKPEYEDLKKIALENNLSIKEVENLIVK